MTDTINSAPLSHPHRDTPGGGTTVTLGDTVRVVNKEMYPIRRPFNNRDFTIPANSDAYVPFEWVKLYFGDPRSGEKVQRVQDERGNDMIIADRRAEVIRLRNYWQSSVIVFREYIPGEEFEGPISDLIPTVEVYSLNGDRIWTVVDDPYGHRVIASSPTRFEQDRSHQQLLEQSQTILEMKKMNELLLRKLGINSDELVNEVASAVANETPAPKSQLSVMEAPTVATVHEKPRMVFNPRTRRVHASRPLESDPTTIEALPEDFD